MPSFVLLQKASPGCAQSGLPGPRKSGKQRPKTFKTGQKAIMLRTFGVEVWRRKSKHQSRNGERGLEGVNRHGGGQGDNMERRGASRPDKGRGCGGEHRQGIGDTGGKTDT